MSSKRHEEKRFYHQIIVGKNSISTSSRSNLEKSQGEFLSTFSSLWDGDFLSIANFIENTARDNEKMPKTIEFVCIFILTIKEWKLVLQVIQLILEERMKNLADMVIFKLCDNIKRLWIDFSNESQAATWKCMEAFAESRPIYYHRISQSILSAIDHGYWSERDKSLLLQIVERYKSHSKVWSSEILLSLLAFKLIRLFQAYLLQPSEKKKINLRQNENSELSQCLNSIFVNHFSIISGNSFREIIRALYDLRPLAMMTKTFPQIYRLVEDCNMGSVQYPMSEFFDYMVCYNRFASLNYIAHLYRQENKKAEIQKYKEAVLKHEYVDFLELVFGDVIRVMLCSNSYSSLVDMPPIIIDLFYCFHNLAVENNYATKPFSFFHSIVIDSFFYDSQPEKFKTRIDFFVHFISKSHPTIVGFFLDIITDRLSHLDFHKLKTQSFIRFIGFLEESNQISSLKSIVNECDSFSESRRSKLNDLCPLRDKNIVPECVSTFPQSNIEINSQKGEEIVKKAVIALAPLLQKLDENTNDAKNNYLSSVCKIIQPLVQPSINNIAFLASTIDFRHVFAYCSSNENSADFLMNWIETTRYFSWIDKNASLLSNPNYYIKVLVNRIDKQTGSWKPFVFYSNYFRQMTEILTAICLHSTVCDVLEISDVVFPKSISLLKLCVHWHSDAQFNLINFFRGTISSPKSLLEFSKDLINHFDEFPDFVLVYFRNIIMQFGLCEQVKEFLILINKTEKMRRFSNEVRDLLFSNETKPIETNQIRKENNQVLL